MRKIILLIMLCLPVAIMAQTDVSSTERLAILKAEAEAKAKAAQEAAQKALEAAKAAEEAAKAVTAETEKVEKAQQKAENERIAAEKAAKEKASEEQKAIRQKAESERIAAEKRSQQQPVETKDENTDKSTQQWTKPVITPTTDASKAYGGKNSHEEEQDEEQKYLAGAVPLVNGVVQWETTINTNDAADKNYQTLLQFLAEMTKDPNQLPTSSVALVNEDSHTIVAHYEEWMVFVKNIISIDRTKFIYNLIATCEGEKVDLKLFRINYIYEEEQANNGLIKAEDWITDNVSLNKKKTKLNRISGKFRKKTIDRKDEIFNNISQVLNVK